MRYLSSDQSKKLIATVLGTLIGAASAHAAPTIVDLLQFDGAATKSAWTTGAQSGGTVGISSASGSNLKSSSGSLKGTYPVATGGIYAWGAYNVANLQTRDLYIDFWAKMPNAKQGLKFLKIFGGNAGGNTGNYANTTFGLDYTGVDFGCMYQVSFGDGSGVANDTANVINFDGTYPQWIGRSYGTAVVSTPRKSRWASSNWGTTWHHFRMHVKFNSGTSAQTEVADGAYYVEIDGVVYVDAKGLLNRHYSNAPIDRVEFFGWSQNGSAPFDVWYDDIKITTGGFSSDVSPKPPVMTVE